ncbi:MAG: hypothetical protein K6G56_00310, partial [Clostridiales bacterium]|nr:hypothetical protein [Clostridiales bacterium]
GGMDAKHQPAPGSGREIRDFEHPVDGQKANQRAAWMRSISPPRGAVAKFAILSIRWMVKKQINGRHGCEASARPGAGSSNLLTQTTKNGKSPTSRFLYSDRGTYGLLKPMLLFPNCPILPCLSFSG